MRRVNGGDIEKIRIMKDGGGGCVYGWGGGNGVMVIRRKKGKGGKGEVWFKMWGGLWNGGVDLGGRVKGEEGGEVL